MFWFKNKRQEEEVVLPVEIVDDGSYRVYQRGKYVGYISYSGGDKLGWLFVPFPSQYFTKETIEAIFNKLAELNLYNS